MKIKNQNQKKGQLRINKQFIKSLFTSKTFRVGGYSIAASIMVIAIAVAINLLIGEIPAEYTKLDMTENQLFSISEQTEQILAALEKKVDIYLIAQSGSEDTTLTQLLERYESISPNLNVIKKDPVVYPNFARQYTSEKIYNNSLIVVCGDKSQYISYTDIFVTDYSNYYYDNSYTTDFDGESRLTSAIDYVTNDNLPKLYALKGHGEQSVSTSIKNSIAKENIQLEDLKLLAEEAVPEDASALFIFGPSADISVDEKDKILSYLKSGGSMIMITDYSDTDMPNLAAIMQDYGVKPVNELVLEGDSSYCVRGYNYYLLPQINSHAITSPLKESGYYVLMPLAHGIVETENHRDTLSITKLLSTSDKAFSKTDGYNMTTMQKKEGDTDGPFALGVAITEAVSDKETQIVWFSTSKLLDDSTNQMVSGGNLDLFLNSISWMCERENNISIHSKSLTAENLVVPSTASSRWSLVFVVLIPLAFLSTGVYVWIIRKRR